MLTRGGGKGMENITKGGTACASSEDEGHGPRNPSTHPPSEAQSVVHTTSGMDFRTAAAQREAVGQGVCEARRGQRVGREGKALGEQRWKPWRCSPGEGRGWSQACERVWVTGQGTVAGRAGR